MTRFDNRHIVCQHMLWQNRIATFSKIDVTSSNALEVKKGKSRDVSGRDPNLEPAREMYYGRGYASLNK